MRIHLLFPLAFVCGIYGFIFFAPYLLCVVLAENIIRVRRQTSRRPIAVPVLARESAAPFAASAMT